MYEDKASETFAEQFSRILFEHYPEWKHCCKPIDPKYQAEDDFTVIIPSRFAPHCPLRIVTEKGQLFIYWAGCWEEWDTDRDSCPVDETISDALELIASILAEQSVVVTSWSDRGIEQGCYYLVKELDERLNSPYSFFNNGFATVIVSWNGTYDRGAFDPAKCK